MPVSQECLETRTQESKHACKFQGGLTRLEPTVRWSCGSLVRGSASQWTLATDGFLAKARGWTLEAKRWMRESGGPLSLPPPSLLLLPKDPKDLEHPEDPKDPKQP